MMQKTMDGDGGGVMGKTMGGDGDADHGGDHAAWSVTDALLVPAGQSAKYLGIDDARQLINAAMFAMWKKNSFNTSLTIRWDCSIVPFDPSPKSWLDRQGRLFERMARWLVRNDIPVSYAWSREIGSRRTLHTHVLLHLPFDQRPALREFLLKSGGFRDGSEPFSPLVYDRSVYGEGSLPQKAGALKYCLKGMDIAETYRDPITGQTSNVMETLRVDDRGEEQRPVAGKRVGVARPLDRQARLEAGWRELTSLRDLYRALNP